MTDEDVSSAMARIRASRRQSFELLRTNGISAAAGDAFESFLQSPETLTRPSLIVRCRRTEREFACRVVTDKSISRPRLERCFLPFLRRLRGRGRGPCDFFVLLSDNINVSPGSSGQFRRFLKQIAFLRCDRLEEDDPSDGAILIPDFRLQEPTYAEELAAVRARAETIDFDSRIEVIKWRGRLSGPDYPDSENCDGFPRYRLLMLSLQHPEIVDARLTNQDNLEGSASALALKRKIEALLGAPEPFLPAADLVPYKYLISLDGAVSAWKRVPTILASGSVLLLQHRWGQFFYPGLEPWNHYVPVKPDISDVLERYAWLRANPLRARAIGDNGRRFAAQALRPPALEDYYLEVLDECTALYQP
jgi:hypothetical protein